MLLRRRAAADGAVDGTTGERMGTAVAGGGVTAIGDATATASAIADGGAGTGRASAPMGFTEFVVLIAAMMATQAIAIDAMLPAFPIIVHAMHVANENHGQWILTAYMAGLGCGQLFWGMMSDRFRGVVVRTDQ